MSISRNAFFANTSGVRIRGTLADIPQDIRVDPEIKERKKVYSLGRKPLDFLVGMTRFELATPCSRSRCATRLRYIPTNRFYSGFELFCQGERGGRRRSDSALLSPLAFALVYFPPSGQLSLFQPYSILYPPFLGHVRLPQETLQRITSCSYCLLLSPLVQIC